MPLRRLRPDGFAMVNLGLLPPEDGDESHPSCRALNAMSSAFEGAPLGPANAAVHKFMALLTSSTAPS